MSTSSWGRELKYLCCQCWNGFFGSTSSWGRELKWLPFGCHTLQSRRPLREVVSWNMISSEFTSARESVDLFVRSWVEIFWTSDSDRPDCSRPLREVVSWNIKHIFSPVLRVRRPLREVVSWNTNGLSNLGTTLVDLFVRSWVEIFKWPFVDCLCVVDLFVRSWVEMSCPIPTYPANSVDLFVRSWVEMWNVLSTLSNSTGRPLREVVSWNALLSSYSYNPVKSTSSWGRELK